MAVNNSLKFYKGWYGKGQSRNLPDVPTAIIFNEEEGLIYVNNKCYGGATDASFVEDVLVISFSDGRQPISIDFSDTASASEVLYMLERIEGVIGASVMTDGSDSDSGLNYDNTNYLRGTETLVEADKNLDIVVYDIDQRVDTLENIGHATVIKTDGAGGEDTTIEVADGDENKPVIGADIYKLAGFTNARIGEEIGKLNSEITSSNSEDPIEFSVTQQNGLVTGVEVSMLGAEISFDGSGSDEVLEVGNENGIVLGSDILKLKDYIDTKFMNDGTVVTNSNGTADALSVVSSTDEQGNKNFDINLFWTEFNEGN